MGHKFTNLKLNYNHIISVALFLLSFSNGELIQSSFSNITIKIRGPGIQNIFYSGKCDINGYITNSIVPDEIYIDDIRQNEAKNNYELEEKIYSVKLVWKNTITKLNCFFKDCVNIIDIDFSNFDFSQGLEANQMFLNCKSLTSLNLHDYGPIKILSVGSMFRYCTSLSFLNLSNFDTSEITDFGGMFNECHSLTSLDLSNFQSNIVNIGVDMFYNCPKLEYVNIKKLHFCSILVIIIILFRPQKILYFVLNAVLFKQ